MEETGVPRENHDLPHFIQMNKYMFAKVAIKRFNFSKYLLIYFQMEIIIFLYLLKVFT